MSLFLSTGQEAELRRQMRLQMAGIVPAQHVDEVIDLAIHAAREAIGSLEAVTDRASSPSVTMAAFVPALGILAGVCQTLSDSAREFAASKGMRHVERNLQL